MLEEIHVARMRRPSHRVECDPEMMVVPLAGPERILLRVDRTGRYLELPELDGGGGARARASMMEDRVADDVPEVVAEAAARAIVPEPGQQPDQGQKDDLAHVLGVPGVQTARTTVAEDQIAVE